MPVWTVLRLYSRSALISPLGGVLQEPAGRWDAFGSAPNRGAG